MNFNQIYCHFLNQNLNYNQAQQIIYDHNVNRKIRFELFITLYNATLNKNPLIAFKVFKEAYCMTDNIYSQIQKSDFKFDIKLFLKDIRNKGVNLQKQMNNEERTYYDKLPKSFTIYRGLSYKEYKSKDYGISWTLDKKIAERYIFYDKNKSEKGGLVSKNIFKKDILTIFNDGANMEVIHLNDEKMSLTELIHFKIHIILNWKTKLCFKYKCEK